MCGLVNQAIKDLVLSQFGEEAWTKMAKEAGISEVDFVSMHYYCSKSRSFTEKVDTRARREAGAPFL
jgi:hypothetical protein